MQYYLLQIVNMFVFTLQTFVKSLKIWQITWGLHWQLTAEVKKKERSHSHEECNGGQDP